MSIMPAILRLLGLAAILAAILLLSPAHVHACDCSEKLGLNDADLVFEGSLDTSTRWWTRQDNQ